MWFKMVSQRWPILLNVVLFLASTVLLTIATISFIEASQLNFRTKQIEDKSKYYCI